MDVRILSYTVYGYDIASAHGLYQVNTMLCNFPTKKVNAMIEKTNTTSEIQALQTFYNENIAVYNPYEVRKAVNIQKNTKDQNCSLEELCMLYHLTEKKAKAHLQLARDWSVYKKWHQKIYGKKPRLYERSTI